MSKRNRHIGPLARSKPSVNGSQKGFVVSNHVPVMDPKEPIPFERFGVYEYLTDAPFIPFLDNRNDFGKHIHSARLLSTTHDACITTKKNFCAGNGFMDTDGKDFEKPITDWFKAINLNDESLLDINKKIFEDYFTFGNVPIEVARMRIGGKAHVFVYVHNFLEWRLGRPDDRGVVTYAIQSKLFLQGHAQMVWQKDDVIASQLPIYNRFNTDEQNWKTDANGVQRTLIWYKNSKSGYPNYGLPSSIASQMQQLLEYKGSRYNLDMFENNGVVGGMLILQGMLGQEEADRIGRKANDMISGDGKRGRMMAFASEEGVDKSTYHPFDTKTDASYIQADAMYVQKIILANEWDALLMGIIAPTTMGKGNGFITKILETKQNFVIKPAQDDLLAKVWGKIFDIAEEWMGLPFSKHEVGFKGYIDISGLTDVDITPAVKVNEVRKAKGLEEDPIMDGVYMSQAKTNQQQTDPNQPPANTGGDNVSA